MGIFNLDLQSQVQPVQAVDNRSTATALGGLSNFLSSMGSLKQINDANAQAGKPTYTQVKDQQEQANLKNYSTALAELTQQRDAGLSPQAYQLKLKALDQNFATQGIDISSSAFDTARTSITGIPSTNWGMTDDQMLMNDLLKTPEGQGQLALANYSLEQELGKPPTQEEVANKVRADQAIKANFDNTTIRNQAELQQKLPIIQDQVAAVANDFNTSINILEKNGVDLTPEMLQNTYVQYRGFKAETLAKLPSDTPQATKDNLFKLTDEFFTSYGMEKVDGVFKIESKAALDLKYKAQLTVKALEERGKGADNLLALGILKNGYSISVQDQPAMDMALSNIDLTPSTPDYITEAGIVLSNDLISTAQAISAPNVTFLRDAKSYTNAFKDAIGQDAYDLNTKQTAAQGWNNFQARSTIIKGWNPADIASGKADPASVYTNVAGLATALGTIDFQNEAASFEGVRSSVSSTLAPIIDALEKADPEKGKAARTLMFYSLGKAAAEYDAQVKAEEKALNIGFNPKSGTYELNLGLYAGSTADQLELDRRQSLSLLINTKFGNDLTQAVANGVTLTEADLKGLKGFEGTTLLAAQDLVDIYMGDLPEADRFKRLLDLRNSRVYLDNVAGQIEPKAMKEARLNTADRIAADTKAALAQTEGQVTAGGITTSTLAPTSTTAALLDKFEGGGDYNALFGFANREGGPFAGTNVSEMTIGQLKDFADNKYADYSRKQLGYKATPMGRYQFVGTTLADVAKRMGLADDTVFSPAVQDQMFTFYAKEVIADKAPAGQRAALRGAWEGLKNASDAELDAMIAEIQSGKASFATSGPTQVTRFQGANPSTPNANPPAQTAPVQTQRSGPVDMPTASQVPTATPTGQGATAALPEQVQAQQQPQGNEPKTAGNTPIDPAILDTISALAQNANDVRVFTTTDEMKQAYTNKEVNIGSLVVINGKLMSVTQDMVK